MISFKAKHTFVQCRLHKSYMVRHANIYIYSYIIVFRASYYYIIYIYCIIYGILIIYNYMNTLHTLGKKSIIIIAYT